MLPLFTVVQRRNDVDCAIVALAMLLGESYEQILRAHAIVRPVRKNSGVWRKDYDRIAQQFGKRIDRVPLDLDRYPIGILTTNDHAVLVFNGHVIDTEDVWDYEDWFQWIKAKKRDCTLHVRRDALL